MQQSALDVLEEVIIRERAAWLVTIALNAGFHEYGAPDLKGGETVLVRRFEPPQWGAGREWDYEVVLHFQTEPEAKGGFCVAACDRVKWELFHRAIHVSARWDVLPEDVRSRKAYVVSARYSQPRTRALNPEDDKARTAEGWHSLEQQALVKDLL